jgi:hypothetical protein
MKSYITSPIHKETPELQRLLHPKKNDLLMQTKQDITQPVFHIYCPGSTQRNGTSRETQGQEKGAFGPSLR